MMRNQFIAGHYRQQKGYKSFSPTKIHTLKFSWSDKKIDLLIEEAASHLSELNAISRLLPDTDFFIHMHVVKESLTSSRIEGTKTEFDEALLPKTEISPERKDDWIEVQNYTKAMNFSIKELRNLPLSMRLLNQAHKILLFGVRGMHKAPGQIRKTQNWIGGSSLKDAFFIPPSADEVPVLLSDLEKFLHDDADIPRLVKIALAHYQFETIHPFLDGNGRIGRLLITLYLVSEKILEKPVLYLSDFFEKHRNDYYDGLTMVRTKNDVDHWLKFFLVGMIETAKNSKETFEKIVKLRDRCEKKMDSLGKRKAVGLEFLLLLYAEPILNAKKVAEKLKISLPSANSLIKQFEELKILKELTGFKRNRLFAFFEYIDVFKKV